MYVILPHRQHTPFNILISFYLYIETYADTCAHTHTHIRLSGVCTVFEKHLTLGTF